MPSRPGDTSAVRLADIAAAIGGDLRGDGERLVERIGPLEAATPTTISFLAQTRLKPLLDSTAAGAVIVREDVAPILLARGVAAVVVADPYLAFARLTRWWAARTRPLPEPGVHPSAYVAPGAHVHPTASVGPFALVEAHAVLAEHVVVGAHAVVGEGAEVGAGTQLRPRSTFAQGCRIGARGIIHSGAVIGADGFGFAPHEGRWEKIEQLGGVRIGDDVEIGANTCVDRGALDDTVIEDGVKLDNLIQIAHNVHIGAHTAMAGCVGVAGSAKIGKHCTFGGAAMILGHLQIADHVHISAASVVMSSILKPGQYSGVFPIDENGNWEKNAATLRQLHTLRARLRTLEKKKLTMNTVMDIHQILKRLPHRYPLLLVDRVVELEKNVRIQALKNVTINEPFFTGHFPHRPVMPGVLILEAMAQSAALLSFASMDTDPGDDTVVYFAGIDAARFKRPVEPGDQLMLEALIDRVRGGIHKYKAKATVAGETVAEAELMCTMRKIG